MTAVVAAQNKTPSVLVRVQNENDPELGELIRAALDKQSRLPNSKRKEPLELIRKITLSYTQIKLFDQQIAEVSRRLEAETGPDELQHELMLSKAELESKRMTELANLREVMGIIPRHAFEKQPIENLNTWLHFNVIDDRIYVLETLKPFSDYWARGRWESAGLLSERETLDYIRERFKSRNNLPIRIDINHKSAMSSTAEDLRKKIVSLAIETHSQMETEVCSELSTWVGSGVSTFFVREGKIRTLYPAPVRRPDKGLKPLVSGLVNPNDVEQHILWRLTMPKNVPLKFRIEHDEESALLARQVVEMCKATIIRLGTTEVVEVEESIVQPVPEAVFLGHWQAVGDANIKDIKLQSRGQSQLTIVTSFSSRTQKKTLSTIPAPWILATKEIFIDRGQNQIYRGYINAEGNLVLERGQIFPQGSFHTSGPPLMVYKKVE
jgi:hypothetical protein